MEREVKVSGAEWLSVILPRLFPDADAEELDRIRSELFEEETMLLLDKKLDEWGEKEQRVGFVRGEAHGMERGKAEGIARERALLCKQARLKFGAAVAEELARRLEPVSDAEALEEVGVLLFECADGAELLARVRPNGAA